MSTIDAFGKRTDRHGMQTDTIGWRVPAVPTEDGTAFYGYTSVPADGCEWWRRLPTRPLVAGTGPDVADEVMTP